MEYTIKRVEPTQPTFCVPHNNYDMYSVWAGRANYIFLAHEQKVPSDAQKKNCFVYARNEPSDGWLVGGVCLCMYKCTRCCWWNTYVRLTRYLHSSVGSSAVARASAAERQKRITVIPLALVCVLARAAGAADAAGVKR